MKKIAIVALFLVSLTANAQSFNWYRVFPSPFITQQSVRANVVNNTFFPVYCRGFVQGITFRGLRVTSWINRWVGGGQFASIFVYNNNSFDPFVNQYSEIFLSSIRPYLTNNVGDFSKNRLL